MRDHVKPVEGHGRVRQLHPRYPDLEESLVREEVQVAIALRLCVMNRMPAGGIRMTKPATGTKIYLDGQRSGLAIKHRLPDLPRRTHPHRCSDCIRTRRLQRPDQ